MKKTLKKLFACAMSAALVLALAAGCKSKEDTITIYTSPDFPPYEYMEGKNFVGIDMELAKEIGKKLGKTVKLVQCDFDGIINAIDSKLADMAISGITITDTRKEEVDFSDPYIVSVQYLILRADSEITCMEDLAGKKVGVARGYTGQTLMEDQTTQYEDENENMVDGVLKGKGTEIKIYARAMEASLDLAKDKNPIDAVVMDALVAESIAGKNNKLKAIPLKYKNSDIPEEEFGVIVPKGDPNKILDDINELIAELKGNGQLDKWAAEYANKEVKDEK